MKTDIIYPYYLCYIDNRLGDGKISKGAFSLLKISSTAFEDFKFNFENDELFKLNIIESYKVRIRDEKIDIIINDFNRGNNDIG